MAGGSCVDAQPLPKMGRQARRNDVTTYCVLRQSGQEIGQLLLLRGNPPPNTQSARASSGIPCCSAGQSCACPNRPYHERQKPDRVRNGCGKNNPEFRKTVNDHACLHRCKPGTRQAAARQVGAVHKVVCGGPPTAVPNEARLNGWLSKE